MRSVTGFGYAMNIYVGSSRTRTKQIYLPYEGMFVQPVHVPKNPMKNRWRHMTFNANVRGKTLEVTREDSDRGWNIPLVFKAFYSKDVLHTHKRALDLHIQNEGSVLTVKLRLGEKIRCAPKTLIFKEEEIKRMNVNISPMPAHGGLGLLRGSLRDLNQGIKQSFSGEDDDDEKMAEYSYTNEDSIYEDANDESNRSEDKQFSIVTLGVQFPYKILHLSLGEYGNRIIFRRGTHLASSADVEVIDSDFLDSFQSLVGHGEVFLQIGPTLKRMVLKEEEAVAVRHDCLLAFTQDVKSSMQSIDKLKGIFDNKVTYRKLVGPGILWLDYRQSNILVENFEDEELSIAKDTVDDFDPTNDSSDYSIVTHEKEAKGNSGDDE